MKESLSDLLYTLGEDLMNECRESLKVEEIESLSDEWEDEDWNDMNGN